MLQISLRFWKEQTSVFQLNFAIWLHVAVEWAGLGVSGALVDVKGAMVDVMVCPPVEGMGVGAVGGYQTELVAVVLTVTPGIGTYLRSLVYMYNSFVWHYAELQYLSRLQFCMCKTVHLSKTMNFVNPK